MNITLEEAEAFLKEQARKARERDLKAAEEVLAKFVPDLVEHSALKRAIADAIEAGRSQ